MRKIGAYVHIPFCKQKCYYCDFISYPKMEKYEENYIESVIKEIRNFKIENPKTEFDTIYIGGGTPSYIKAENIKAILNELGTKSAKEITLELNPGTFLEEKIKIYKEAGINRISIGLQSSKDFLLKEIGRIHNFEEFLSTYKALKEKYPNIAEDLIMKFFHDMEDIAMSTLVEYECEKEYGCHIGTEELYREAVDLLEWVSGGDGAKWKAEDVIKLSGINFIDKKYTTWDYVYTVNMLYSDYCNVFTEPKYYLEMAKNYLEDPDYFGESSERAYHNAVKRIKYEY